MKRIFIFLTIFSLLLGSIKAEESYSFKCESPFADVERDTTICYYTNLLYFNQVVSGYSDKTFRVGNNVTRAEFSTFVSKAFGFFEDIPSALNEVYPDVPKDLKFASSIFSLQKNKIMNGFSDGNFRPDEFVTRGQVASVLSKSIEKTTGDRIQVSDSFLFEDLSNDNIFKEAILKIYYLSEREDPLDQIISTTRNFYNSNSYITRGELSKMTANSMNIANVPLKSSLPKLSEIADGINKDASVRKHTYSLYSFKDHGIVVARTSGDFEFRFDASDLDPLSVVADQNDFSFAMNGSYFGVQTSQRPLSEVLDLYKDYVIVEGTDSYLRVRSTPDSDDTTNIIGQLYDGDIVEKLNENSEWYKVRYNDRSGWISKGFSRNVDLQNDTQKYYKYDHAGFLNLYGDHLAPLKKVSEDKQVTHIVRLDKSTGKVSILDRESFDPKPKGNSRYLEFQTGPLLYSNHEIQRDLIENSKNGNMKRERNILVVEQNSDTKYFVITNKPYTYYELLNIVLNLDIVEDGDLEIISLDGGSSVSTYSSVSDDFSIYPEKKLPVVIGIK